MSVIAFVGPQEKRLASAAADVHTPKKALLHGALDQHGEEVPHYLDEFDFDEADVPEHEFEYLEKDATHAPSYDFGDLLHDDLDEITSGFQPGASLTKVPKKEYTFGSSVFEATLLSGPTPVEARKWTTPSSDTCAEGCTCIRQREDTVVLYTTTSKTGDIIGTNLPENYDPLVLFEQGKLRTFLCASGVARKLAQENGIPVPPERRSTFSEPDEEDASPSQLSVSKNPTEEGQPKGRKSFEYARKNAQRLGVPEPRNRSELEKAFLPPKMDANEVVMFDFGNIRTKKVRPFLREEWSDRRTLNIGEDKYQYVLSLSPSRDLFLTGGTFGIRVPKVDQLELIDFTNENIALYEFNSHNGAKKAAQFARHYMDIEKLPTREVIHEAAGEPPRNAEGRILLHTGRKEPDDSEDLKDESQFIMGDQFGVSLKPLSETKEHLLIADKVAGKVWKYIYNALYSFDAARSFAEKYAKVAFPDTRDLLEKRLRGSAAATLISRISLV